MRCSVVMVLIGVLLTGCSDQQSQATGPAPSDTSPSSTTSSSTASSAPRSPAPRSPVTSPSPTTLGQRLRAVRRDRAPSARDIIDLAESPTSWRVADGRVLVGYRVPSKVDWPDRWGAPAAWQVLDRRGEVVGQWAERADHTYVPAGRYFVGLHPSYSRVPEEYGDADRALLVRRGRPTRLRLVPGARSRRPAELRVDGGWLVDPSRLTITREELPLCFRGSSRVDPYGRVWCLNRRKDEVLWRDQGEPWQRHRLSTSYFNYCDGGGHGADMRILGDVVTVGLLRADFSVDRGETWWTVSLPVGRIGAGVPRYGEQNCADVSPLPDHRLVVGYAASLVATDASNTRFREVATPGATRFVGVQEGVMLAASRQAYGDLFASYDSATWRPLRAPDLARSLLARPEQH